MASVRRLWLAALLGFAGTSLSAPSRPAVEKRHTLDDIDLPPSVPAKIKVTDTPGDPLHGKFIKMRYGPYVVPPNSNWPYRGMDWGKMPDVTPPCTECYLGAFQGGLEYKDGSEANVDTGMYMHHFVVVNNNKPDWLCPFKRGQYIYNSGNERPPVRLNSKYNFGMLVNKGDKFSAAVELMNMSNQTKTVWTTVIYEVIPINTPGYREATHLRIDVTVCGGSHVPAKKGAYQYVSDEYESPYAGVILHSDGHGHSGTTDVALLINGTTFCNSRQYYGLRPGWIQPPSVSMQHDRHSTQGATFISDAGACEDYGEVGVGDRLKTVAWYNEAERSQMLDHHGRLDAQMGISFLYIGMMDDNAPKAPIWSKSLLSNPWMANMAKGIRPDPSSWGFPRGPKGPWPGASPGNNPQAGLPPVAPGAFPQGSSAWDPRGGSPQGGWAGGPPGGFAKGPGPQNAQSGSPRDSSPSSPQGGPPQGGWAAVSQAGFQKDPPSGSVKSGSPQGGWAAISQSGPSNGPSHESHTGAPPQSSWARGAPSDSPSGSQHGGHVDSPAQGPKSGGPPSV